MTELQIACLLMGLLGFILIALISAIYQLQDKVHHMSQILDDKLTALEAAVTAENSVIDGTTALLTELTKLVQDAVQGSTDTAAVARVQAVIDSVNAKAAALSAANAANTPAAPAPTPAPAPATPDAPATPTT